MSFSLLNVRIRNSFKMYVVYLRLTLIPEIKIKLSILLKLRYLNKTLVQNEISLFIIRL